jgi:hypothetical protein
MRNMVRMSFDIERALTPCKPGPKSLGAEEGLILETRRGSKYGSWYNLRQSNLIGHGQEDGKTVESLSFYIKFVWDGD